MVHTPWAVAVVITVVLALISAASRVLREGAPGASDFAGAYELIRRARRDEDTGGTLLGRAAQLAATAGEVTPDSTNERPRTRVQTPQAGRH
jgi:hypothetical protein